MPYSTDAPPSVRCTIDRGIAWVELRRQGGVFVLDAAVIHELDVALDRVELDRPACLVLSGDSRVFCAGADLAELGALAPEEFAAWNQRLARAITRVAELPMPVLAALHGHALGGGYELALAADHRVAAAQAIVGLPEVNLGFIPGAGGLRRLARLVGPHRASWMAMSAQTFVGDAAFAAGLVDEIHVDPRARCHELAKALSTRSAEALTGVKRVVAEAFGSEAYDTEQRIITKLFGTSTCQEAIRAFAASAGGGRNDYEED